MTITVVGSGDVITCGAGCDEGITEMVANGVTVETRTEVTVAAGVSVDECDPISSDYHP